VSSLKKKQRTCYRIDRPGPSDLTIPTNWHDILYLTMYLYITKLKI